MENSFKEAISKSRGGEMLKNLLYLFLILTFLFNSMLLKAEAISPDSRIIGTNLAGISDWVGWEKCFC